MIILIFGHDVEQAVVWTYELQHTKNESVICNANSRLGPFQIDNPSEEPQTGFLATADRFLEGFGVREWSKNAPGTRTIIFPVSIPHIVHSRPISSQFWYFRLSPILCISGSVLLLQQGNSVQILHISALANSFCPGTRKIGPVIPKSFI